MDEAYLPRNEHGGRCCGINHLFRLRRATKESLKKAIKSQTGALLEITATDQQLASKELCKLLHDNKFVPVMRFQNPNSHNYVTVFHRLKGNRKNSVDDSQFFKTLKAAE